MRNLGWTLLILLLGSCSGAENKNVAVVQQMFDAFNRHDWQTMAGYYDDHASFLDPSFGKEYVTQNREKTIEKYSDLEKMFPDVHDEVVGIYPSGDKVTVEFISTGTSGDSISFRLPIVTVFTLEGGVIVRDATYYDLEIQ